jgi:PhnB protein
LFPFIGGEEVNMLIPHLYFNGRSEEAIAQYAEAFGAEVGMVIPYPEEEHKKGIMHSEISIHGQRIMLNDNNLGPPCLVVIYEAVEELMRSFEIMKEGSKITSPMTETEYSPCVVGLRDRFGVDWALMVRWP